jgi:hypothetical protein
VKVLCVSLQANWVDYTFDEADQLMLAYATTIHKSQGSSNAERFMLRMQNAERRAQNAEFRK